MNSDISVAETRHLSHGCCADGTEHLAVDDETNLKQPL